MTHTCLIPAEVPGMHTVTNALRTRMPTLKLPQLELLIFFFTKAASLVVSMVAMPLLSESHKILIKSVHIIKMLWGQSTCSIFLSFSGTLQPQPFRSVTYSIRLGQALLRMQLRCYQTVSTGLCKALQQETPTIKSIKIQNTLIEQSHIHSHIPQCAFVTKSKL